MKHVPQRGKITIKRWGFRGKKQVIGLIKSWAGNQTRKAKWCKMQVLFLEIDKTKDVKGEKSFNLPAFYAISPLEWSENLNGFVKQKQQF